MSYLLRIACIAFLGFGITKTTSAQQVYNIVYVNGIYNTLQDAYRSSELLGEALEASASNRGSAARQFANQVVWNPAGFEMNYSIGSLEAWPVTRYLEAAITFKEDIAELFWLKSDEETYLAELKKLKYSAGSGYPEGKKVDSIAAQTVAAFIEKLAIKRFLPGLLPGGEAAMDGTKKAVERIAEIGKSQPNSIIVAHSQGNLLANLAYAKVASESSTSVHSNVRVVNVANTAAISINNLNLTHSADKALASLIGLGLLASRTTVSCDGVCDFNVEVATFESIDEITADDNKHNFIAVYMSSSRTRKLVRSDGVIDNGGVMFRGEVASFRDRLEDLVYAAAYSFERAEAPPNQSLNEGYDAVFNTSYGDSMLVLGSRANAAEVGKIIPLDRGATSKMVSYTARHAVDPSTRSRTFLGNSWVFYISKGNIYKVDLRAGSKLEPVLVNHRKVACELGANIPIDAAGSSSLQVVSMPRGGATCDSNPSTAFTSELIHSEGAVQSNELAGLLVAPIYEESGKLFSIVLQGAESLQFLAEDLTVRYAVPWPVTSGLLQFGAYSPFDGRAVYLRGGESAIEELRVLRWSDKSAFLSTSLYQAKDAVLNIQTDENGIYFEDDSKQYILDRSGSVARLGSLTGRILGQTASDLVVSTGPVGLSLLGKKNGAARIIDVGRHSLVKVRGATKEKVFASFGGTAERTAKLVSIDSSGAVTTLAEGGVFNGTIFDPKVTAGRQEAAYFIECIPTTQRPGSCYAGDVRSVSTGGTSVILGKLPTVPTIAPNNPVILYSSGNATGYSGSPAVYQFGGFDIRAVENITVAADVYRFDPNRGGSFVPNTSYIK